MNVPLLELNHDSSEGSDSSQRPSLSGDPAEGSYNEKEFVAEELNEIYSDIEDGEINEWKQTRLQWLGQQASTCKRYIPKIPSTLSFESIKIFVHSNVGRGLYSLVPSFLQLDERPKAKNLHPTSYLDGARGIAAFCVFLHHFYQEFCVRPDFDSTFLHLPWIFMLTGGRAAVAIFFVISGFSLSYKPIKLLRINDCAAFAEAMTSSVFRRWFRLFLPVTIITIFEMLAAYAGFFKRRPQDGIPQGETFASQFDHWKVNIISFVDPFRYINLSRLFQDGFAYDKNLWTIPVEFRGSIWVFLTLIALANFRTGFRVAMIVLFALYCINYVYWDMFLFLCGTLAAELHFIREERAKIKLSDPNERHQYEDSISKKRWRRFIKYVSMAFWGLNFLGATFILSMPVYSKVGDGDYGFITLWSWTPSQFLAAPHNYRFWPAIGAVWLILTVDNGKFLQCIYTNAFAQYLGKISFCLYLVHGSLLKTFGWWFGNWLVNTSAGRGMNFKVDILITLLVCMSVVIWAADVATRLVDDKSVRFGRWLYSSMRKRTS